MIPVPTERPDADAPTPQHGVEQAALQEVAQPSHQQLPPTEPSAMEKVSDVVEGIVDVTDVIGGILSLFDD